MNNPDELIAIKERWTKATPGTWTPYWDNKVDFFSAPNNSYMFPADYFEKDDTEFISHAWNDIEFLLSQLQQKDEEIQKLRKERDEARRKAQEAWAEIDDAEEKILSVQVERDRYEMRMKENHSQALKNAVTIDELRDQLQSAQQEIERLKIALFTHESYDKTCSEMYEREQKLIEGLRWYADERNWRGGELVMSKAEADCGERAEYILQEIGVDLKEGKA